MSHRQVRTRSAERARDAGQAVVLVLAAVVLAVVCTVALASFGRSVLDHEQAQAAADAAALAATTGGGEAAQRLATANGAVLTSFAVLDAETGTVQVTVAIGSVRATARATRAP
ncbi:MAG: pilus assembly protein TadG-related protein [Actinomycetota bacterium]|nr:pilus assembly protein TadG-related protein [Actinomycetota bacterium]